MKNKILLCLTMMMTSLILTGCWDSVEINERHVVLDIAIDKYNGDDKGESVENKPRYQITYMIPDIAKLSGQDSLVDNVKTAMIVKSPTISKSIDDVETKTQNTLTFSHTKAVIFGEEVLKDEELFKSAIDGLIRNSEVGKGTNLLVARGVASEISQSDNYQNPIVGLYIMKYFSNSERSVSYAKKQVIGEVVKEMNDTGVTTIPVIANGEDGAFEIEGAAIIKDYKLVDWIDKDEVRGQLFINGNVKRVPIVVKYKGDYLTYKIEHQKTSINFSDEKGPKAIINTMVKGSITDYTSSKEKSAFRKDKMDEIAALLETEINRQIQKTVDKSQSINTDFLGIGLQMYRQYPKLWEKYGLRWNDTEYAKIPVEINTEVIIENTGILE